MNLAQDITAADITAAVAARVAALVKADPRKQLELAPLAYPDLSLVSGLRRLQRLMTGAKQLTARDAAALSRALGCSWRAFYTEAEGGPSVMGADST